jgi:TonB family protein
MQRFHLIAPFVALTLPLFLASAWAQQEGTAPKLAQAEGPTFARSTPATGPNVATPPASCPATFDDSLATDGIVGKNREGVKLPKLKFSTEAEFSDEARHEIKRKHLRSFEAVSLISIIVDVNGKPQDLCVKKAAGLGLDAQAAKAVWQYQFDPATKNDKPVPMRVTIEVNFKIY